MRITNENKSIEEKVNYFLSRYRHFHSYAGSEFQFEIENQLSLLKKIDFQFSNDKEYRVQYIDTYFRNSLFTQDGLWDDYKNFAKIKTQIESYNCLTKHEKDKKQALIDSSNFQHSIKDLIVEMEHIMPESLYKNLMEVFQCTQPLNEHEHISKLNLLAQLIVSGGFFSGKTFVEIDSLMRSIFDKNRSFPYPTHIKTQTEKRKFDNEGKLSNQMLGFTSIVRKDSQSGLVIMRLFGGEFPPDFNFEYNGVMFLGRSHPKILKIQESIKDEYLNEIFLGGDFIFVCTNLLWSKPESIAMRMKQMTVNQINFFSSVCERDFNLDLTGNLIIANKHWKNVRGLWSTRDYKRIPSNQILELKNNAFNALSKAKNSDSKDWFLSLEPLFVNATKNSSMVDYWIYLETLLSYKRQNKEVKALTSSIILLNEKQQQLNRIFITLSNIFSPFSSTVDLLNMSYQDQGKIRSKLYRQKLPKALRDVQDPFVQELIKEYDSPFDAAYYQKAKNYYCDILIEAYSNRNFSVHKGIISDNLNTKLEKILPLLSRRLRWILMTEIPNQPQLPFNLLIDSLVKKANLLLK